LSGATVLFLSTILAKDLLYNGNVQVGLGRVQFLWGWWMGLLWIIEIEKSRFEDQWSSL